VKLTVPVEVNKNAYRLIDADEEKLPLIIHEFILAFPELPVIVIYELLLPLSCTSVKFSNVNDPFETINSALFAALEDHVKLTRTGLAFRIRAQIITDLIPIEFEVVACVDENIKILGLANSFTTLLIVKHGEGSVHALPSEPVLLTYESSGTTQDSKLA
jgi:hypothetical protein